MQTLNEWFRDFHIGNYEMMVIEYPCFNLYIKAQENGTYVVMNDKHIIVDVVFEEMLKFFMNPVNTQYTGISFWSRN
jgi:hypothetical protein